MGFRITTWNVNGIRNPFSYEPWRSTRTFEFMFDILEADIVVFQETKIQRKDLRDDMVMVPGWDCYFSYSGVVIYTRNATCAPIRAEEGLTGTLCPPNSSVSFRDLPGDQQIGGYPTLEQLSLPEVDAAVLDSEGRCVILEFPAFVLLGVYCPANRDETRDNFRHSFLDLLDARVRNLVAMGKRVFVTGDLNISTGMIDSAHASENIRKGSLTEDEYISAPARRFFNHLLSGGKVVGERDEGREQPVLHDICRSFHPDRRAMYTCWEQRINARPGNYGARIDYVLSSLDMQNWFSDSNIQEGLMGSDHCPVFAVFKDIVPLDGDQVSIHDLMNPSGVFENGKRLEEYSPKLLLPLSGRLIPEFDKRRSIKDMFMRKPSSVTPKSSSTTSHPPSTKEKAPSVKNMESPPTKSPCSVSAPLSETAQSKGTVRKRSDKTELPSVKRSKPMITQSTSGQSSLKGFFKPKSTPVSETQTSSRSENGSASGEAIEPLSADSTTSTIQPEAEEQAVNLKDEINSPVTSQEETPFIDPIVSKEDWSKLFTRKPPPKCEGHDEPCVSLKTKKPGINCGRSFWICPRPLGPSGNKERGTGWRCSTFIWASDWDSSTM
ncbi:hypothetical protein ARAM_000121 [Aspergillus rambellii]|uniref:DNA-(apurinic or apyrimidinic site) endonuclease 2 n=1 Tax=Aspergillus rambellii TaxID=308745 RepID=A0A0F8XN12_9EURO|nr:hypothetical protein ARAM_000121 [Aspergillus rambellii]